MSDDVTSVRVTSEGNPELARALNRAMTGNDEGGQMMEAAMATPLRQLSFEVGGDPAERLEASLSISGKLEIREDLDRDAEVTINVVGPGGVLLATGDAVVNKIGFVTHRGSEEPDWTERTHTAKIEASE